MRYEWIKEWSQFEQLNPEWNDLLHRSSADTVFLTWEWVHSCGEAVDWDLQPFVIIVRNDAGVLVGVAPLYLKKYRLLRLIPIRLIQFLTGVVEGSEYFDFIVDKNYENEVYPLIMSALLERQSEWDCVFIRKIAGWTGARERILGACRTSSTQANERVLPFSAISLPDDSPSFSKMLSSRKRGQLRKEIKQAFMPHDARILMCETEHEIPKFIDALLKLHFFRWQLRGEEGAFKGSPVEVRFYRKFLPLALCNNWLRFVALDDGIRFRASQIGYVYKNIFSSIQEGFDPTYTKGVGNALRGQVIEKCIDDGIHEYDFLGGYSDHKRRWAAQKRHGYDILIGHKLAMSRFVLKAGIWPTGRFLRPVCNKLVSSA